MEILLFCGGLAIGFVVAWLYFRIKSVKLSEMIRNLELNLEAEKRLAYAYGSILENSSVKGVVMDKHIPGTIPIQFYICFF